MNFFLDENIPKKAADYLLENNHVIFDIRGSSKEGIDDYAIFDLAKKAKAVFLTTDKDFYHTIHFTEKPHYGIIVIALRQPNTAAILEKLQWILLNIAKLSFENTCHLVTDNQCIIFR